MTLPVIALTGLAGSGKSTVSELLSSVFGYSEYTFADALKTEALGLNPGVGDVSLDFLVSYVGWNTAKLIPQVRSLLQDLGSALRSIDPDYWVRRAVDEARGESLVVFSDVRYENEMQAVKEFAQSEGVPFYHIHVHRSSVYRELKNNFHESELMAAKFSAAWAEKQPNCPVIQNDWDVDSLEVHLRSLLRSYAEDGQIASQVEAAGEEAW